MPALITTLLPIVKALWGTISDSIKVLRQKGELTPQLEAEFEATKKKLFASGAAQVEPDPS